MFIDPRKLIVLLLAVSLAFPLQSSVFKKTESEPGRVVLNCKPQLPEFETRDGYTHIVSPESGKTLETGLPELPVYSVFVPLISNEKPVLFFTVLSSHTLENLEIFPVQSTEGPEAEDREIVRDENFYSSTAVYPQNNVSMSDVLTLRGKQMVRVDVIPCTYQPAAGELEIFDQIEITVSGESVTNSNSLSSGQNSRAFEPIYRQMFPNYESSQRDEDYQEQAILYICGGNTISNPYFLQLVDWRHKSGFKVYKATSGLIGNTPDDIKDYITEAYNTFDPPPEYVTLIGDVGGAYNIPTWFESWSQCYGGACNGEGDYPYSLLEGNDLLPEVIIGRISVRNSQELAIVVTKTINYEKVVGHDTPWFDSSGLLVNPEAGGGGQSLISTNNYLQMLFQNQDYSDIRYDVEYNAQNASYWLNNQLDAGVSYLNFRGLYGPSSFDIDLILNDIGSHSMLPFVTFITCGTGSFAYEESSPSERFLRSGISPSNYSGGVACISTATVGTHTQFNNLLDMGVYDGIFVHQCETAGAALVSGKLALLSTYPDDPSHYVSIFSHWNNLMGDPALHLWTAEPANLSVTHPASITFGTNRVEVLVNENMDSPVEGALVTLTMADEIFITHSTDENGLAIFNLDYQNDGVVSVTVTGHNLEPYEGVMVIDTVGPVLNLDTSVTVDDSSGNDDGYLNPGEDAQLTFSLGNSGTTLPAGQVQLHSASTYITTDSEPVVITELIAGNSVQASFPVSVNINALDGDDANLWLEVVDESDHSWNLGIVLSVQAGTCIYSSYQLLQGENLTAGMTNDIVLFVENIGSIPHTDLQGELSYQGNQPVTVSQAQSTWSVIESGQSQTSQNPFSISLDPNVIAGSDLLFQLHLSDADGYIQDFLFSIPAGEANVDAPTGPDSFGHYIYDSGDTEYSLTPDFGWDEIAPEKGGPGTSLPMTDCGNGVPFGQESQLVSLPFELNFYGEVYDEITVSTNGWIAFGSTAMATFRNTPIPGPAGPSPMLAVFWDDLRNLNPNCFGSVGSVSTYIAPDSSYLIVEWADVETYFLGDSEYFEAILFRNEAGQSMDNDIKIQYRKFNNTSAGLYLPAYNGLIHGGYATIGLEDHTGLVGLQYTYDNEYPPTARPLENNSSLFITTRLPVHLFTADTLLGEPPLTVQFNGNTEYQDVSWAWDFDGDGQVDSTDPNSQWTYTDYGHYTVKLTVTDGASQYEDLRRHYIHLVTYGCTDPVAYNFDETAAMDDGACDYVYGCMDPAALNYNASAVYDDGTCFYIQYVTISGSGGQDGDNFGRAMAKSGDIAVVGAQKEDISGQMDQGAAYIYQLDDLGNWSQLDELTANDGSLLDYFGNAVAVSGDYILIGAYKADDDNGVNMGAAYLFHRGTEGDWTQQSKITPDDGETNDYFGISVALENGTAVVGAYRDDNENGDNAGAVYIFDMDNDSNWNQTAKLIAEDGQANDAFGAALDLSANRILVGSDLYDGAGLNNCGAAHIFVKGSDGLWSQESRLMAEDADSFDHFGYSVALDDSTALIGSYLDNNDNGTIAGAAYIFTLSANNWQQTNKLIGVSGSDFYFGSTVGLDGNYAAIGSDQRLFFYRRDEENQWSEGDGFVTNTNEQVFVDSLHVLAANYHNELVHAYSLAEWEEWLSVDDPIGLLPQQYSLGQNYPNPFNPVTVIPYDIPVFSEVSLIIYNLQGRQVAELLHERQLPGHHSLKWNAEDLPSGIYLLRLKAGGVRQSRKITLLK